ncbi:MAG: transposase [Saccharofermentans sp.]|nr:transposase [Saccharofermentans sp.]
MPRTRRMKSRSGIYHVMARGTDKQIIFEDTRDYIFFRKMLFRYSKEQNISIIAYCLMSNHFHLLIKDEQGELSLFMKRLQLTYVKYFNDKYERCGHLFQDRFKSECVEDDRYLLTVFRYILNNPVKAGICRVEDYRWSSYSDYFDEDSETDLEIIRNYIDDDRRYKDFIDAGNKEANEYEDNTEFLLGIIRDDEWAAQKVKELLGVNSVRDIGKYSSREKNMDVAVLRSNGLTPKQIRRITGIRTRNQPCMDFD